MKIRRDQVRDYVRKCLSNSKEIADGNTFEQIQEFCQNEEIKVNEEMIVEFLNKKAEEDGVDMSETVESSGWVDLTAKNSDSLIKRSVENFKKQLQQSKYRFNAIDLRYFKDCFKIYKEKCLKLCEVVEMLRGRIDVDKELFKSLDISYNSDYVSGEDVDRIVIPLIYNFSKAIETYYKANNLNTYLTTTIDEHRMAVDGVSYWEIIPSKDLQIKSGIIVNNKCFVDLTERQKQELEKEKEANFEAAANMLLDRFWE